MPQLTTFRLYLLGIALLFVGYVALEYNRPKPLNWSPTYINKDKIPYGTFVLYDQLPHLLGTDSVEAVRLPAYSQLTGLSSDAVPFPKAHSIQNARKMGTTALDSSGASDSSGAIPPSSGSSNDTAASTASVPADSSSQARAGEPASIGGDAETADRHFSIPLRAGQANYLFVNESFELSRPDAHALLQFVARGNNAFVAAQTFGGGRLLRDSLGFRTQEAEPSEAAPKPHPGFKALAVVDTVDLRFTNLALQHAQIRLPGTGVPLRFVVDSGRAGRTLATDAQGRAVFIRLDYGRGHFYLCSLPLAFTNYYLLRPRSAAFAAAALAYLPTRRTWWDEYQKQGPAGEQSLLRVVFAHEALRQAYYLALAGALLFVLVAARRRQRIIPTLNALPNTTLLFTRTVAGLYRQGSSHALIAEKKVGLFLEYLRIRFQETSPDFGDPDFRERLSQKAGVPRPRVDELFRLVNFARTAPRMTDHHLLVLSKALSDFRLEANR